ncbi:MAG: hypothetical protein KGQ36_05950 [Rickettsiales bacterium]|nr:hypothetical protein [Rickettsiales bacterium]
MRPNLSNSENLIAVGNSYSTRQLSLMDSTANDVKHYIGTIEIPGIARGTACLLKSGKILTCLHNILDYGALDEGKAQLIDFRDHDVSVYFVKDDNIYKYKINSAPVTGLNKLKTQGARAWCFDYALLETEGNPVRDLGGGFTPDQTDHFGSASVTDPTQTLAISGPFVTRTAEGEIKFHRFASLSNNQAAESGPYHITQGGEHPSAPGFSGMGIIPIDRDYSIDTLYAIHSYRDNQGQQTGAKISEISSAMGDSFSAVDDSRLDPYVIHTLNNWYETLRIAIINPDRSVSPGNVIDFEDAVQIVMSGKGNYLSDLKGRAESKEEVMRPMKEAVKREGKYAFDQIQDDSIPHNPGHKKELPHLHHPSHGTAQGNPVHAIYDTGYWQRKALEEQEKKRKDDENRKRQLDATKARDEKLKEEAESKATKIKKEQEEKERAKQERHGGKKSGKGSRNSGGRF